MSKLDLAQIRLKSRFSKEILKLLLLFGIDALFHGGEEPREYCEISQIGIFWENDGATSEGSSEKLQTGYSSAFIVIMVSRLFHGFLLT